MAGLENYTFLTPKPMTQEPNVYGRRKEQFMEGFSNAPPGDHTPTEIEDWWDQPITTPMVAETLSWLGVQVLGENEWEDGLYGVLEELTDENKS